MLDPKLFCPLYGFCEKTQETATAGSASLSLTPNLQSALSMALTAKGEGAYARLMLTNGITSEEVVYQLTSGVINAVTTPSSDYPSCSKLFYETTKDVVSDLIACLTDTTDTTVAGSIPDIKIEGFDRVTDTDGNLCFEAQVPDCEWKSGTHRIASVNGRITSCEPLAANEIIEDGIYTAVESITVVNGCITNITQGTAASGVGSCNTCDAADAGTSQ